MSFSRFYKKVKSTNNVSINNFVSEIPFEFKTGMLEYIDPLKTFMSIRLVIGINNTAAAADYTSTAVTCLRPIPCSTANVGDFIPYLSKNPLCGLFNTGRLSVNDKTISNLNDIASTNTLIRSVFDSQIMENTINGTNPIYPQGIEDRIIKAAGNGQIIGGAYDDAPIIYTGRSAYAWKNMGPFKYNIENTLNMSLPFPLFSTYNADGIPTDTSVNFSFNVDSDYPTNIVQFIENLTSTTNNVAQQISIVALNSTTVKAYTIGVGVTDVTLYLSMANK